MDDDVDIGTEMVEELGIAPAAGIDDRQRYELLRQWHQEPAKDDEDGEKTPKP